ncbi:hypothetical protein [Mesoterricola sediminis]|uniref:hypothetical protein n=1 Tax=Mesoterricola sediminis TaxID=2927980 RepID=UPI001FAED377|nr:hypothetical protein [Mesoterricola sediminis]
MRDASAAEWVPADVRDPAQVQARVDAWARRVAPLQAQAAVRILLPRGEGRIPLLLAAAQALRAAHPGVVLYLAFDPEAPPILDEAAWGAVQGGALLPADLGPDPAAWGPLLARAQEGFPGRPWSLWLPSDPGPRLGQLLGDGGRVVAPPGTPAARLAQEAGTQGDVEGGFGTLLLRDPATGQARAWRFENAAWVAAAPPRDRHEVQVTAREAYDVGALLAKVRAERLRESLRVKTVEADLALDLHIQSEQGTGTDLGFRFRAFRAAGEPEETLQKEVLFNGVRAKIGAGLQLPIVESRVSMAAPAALTLTERYRYEDGGPAGPGQRFIRFTPADGDPLFYTGTLRVDEASGRVLEERSGRSGLPGIIKSEDRILTYGEPEPGLWTQTGAQTFERWVVGGRIAQVSRTAVYSNFLFNGGGFSERREAVRKSDGTMLRATPDGVRYFNKQADGTRVTEARPRSWGRGVGGLLLIDPTLPLPVIPLGGLAYFDYDAWGKGIQISALTAILYNQGQMTIPNAFAGFDASVRLAFSLLPSTQRPIRNGHPVDGEGVGLRSGRLVLGLAHDLGAGFRLQGRADLAYEHFSKPWKDDHWTPGFILPPSGWNRQLTGELSWLHRGFRLAGFYGEGRRPEGIYGLPWSFSHTIADYQRWGGSVGYDLKVGQGAWVHGEAGYLGGKGFDRFQSLDLGGTGGDVRIAGLRSDAITSDQVTYAKAGLVLPTGPRLRLTLSLDQAWARALDDRKTYALTGLGIAGDLPGFGWFTTVRVDLGVGLASTLPGARSVNGYVALLRVF